MSMNLEDFKGGEWLETGSYIVEVKSFIKKDINDKELIEYTCETPDGLKTRLGLWNTEAAGYRIRNFAVACGFTQEEREDFDFQDAIGRQLWVGVEQDEKGFHHVETYWNLEAPAPKPKEKKPEPPVPVPSGAVKEGDCPF